jgi:hypothetical protein
MKYYLKDTVSTSMINNYYSIIHDGLKYEIAVLIRIRYCWARVTTVTICIILTILNHPSQTMSMPVILTAQNPYDKRWNYDLCLPQQNPSSMIPSQLRPGALHRCNGHRLIPLLAQLFLAVAVYPRKLGGSLNSVYSV